MPLILKLGQTLQWISHQLLMIEQCYNLLNILPVSDESLCNITIYLHLEVVFLLCILYLLKFGCEEATCFYITCTLDVVLLRP